MNEPNENLENSREENSRPPPTDVSWHHSSIRLQSSSSRARGKVALCPSFPPQRSSFESINRSWSSERGIRPGKRKLSRQSGLEKPYQQARLVKTCSEASARALVFLPCREPIRPTGNRRIYTRCLNPARSVAVPPARAAGRRRATEQMRASMLPAQLLLGVGEDFVGNQSTLSSSCRSCSCRWPRLSPARR